MKRKRQWVLLVVAGLAIAAFLPAFLARAGEQRPREVVRIVRWTHGGYATGALGELRNSDDARQLLRCWIEYDGSGGCEAREASGAGAFCRFASPESAHLNAIRAQVRAINSASEVGFYYSHGNCTDILVRTSSRHETTRP